MKKVSCPYLKYFLNISRDLYGTNNNLGRNSNHPQTLYYPVQFPLTVTCLVLSLFILGMCLLAHLNLDFPDTSALLQDVTKSFSRSIGRRMKKKKKYWNRRATTSYIWRSSSENGRFCVILRGFCRNVMYRMV
jgi:hypothetical protein